MMKMCPLCNTEMPERYNYCYQCGEYVGQTTPILPGAGDPEAEQKYRQQEWVIHYGCLALIILWTIFGVWFFFNSI
jgi:hypothetical protein